MLITDCHIHIQPMSMFKPEALSLMKKKRPEFEEIVEFSHSPLKFLAHMDSIGLDRAVLINYVAPDVLGFTAEVNPWIADYCKADPERLLPCGSIHPRHCPNVQGELDKIVRLGIRLLK